MTVHVAEASITGYKHFEVKKLTDSSHIPTKGHPSDAGWDLYADEDIELWPEETKLISTGIAMSLPKPLPEPVTIHTLFCNSIMSIFNYHLKCF